jgi:hypothetical protein
LGEEKAKEKEKGVGRVPADLHPPLNKKGGLRALKRGLGVGGRKKVKEKESKSKKPGASATGSTSASIRENKRGF